MSFQILALLHVPLMALVPGWLLCISVLNCLSGACDSDFITLRALWSQMHEILAAVVRFSGRWYTLGQGAVSSPHSIQRLFHPTAPELEQRFLRLDTLQPRASCAWRLQPLSLSWSINIGLLFASSSCHYRELQTCLRSCRWHSSSCGPCPCFKANGRSAERAVQSLAEN